MVTKEWVAIHRKHHARLQDWCHRAEASNIVALQSLSRRLRSYA